MRLAPAAAALLSAVLIGASPAPAAERVTVIGLMADSAADMTMAARIAAALDHQAGLRVVPMLGKGPAQTLTDLVHLKGVDAALLPSDTLAYAQRENLLDVKPAKISYVLKLESRDLVLVARKEVADLAGLAGRRVAVGSTADASFVSARLLLDVAQITVEEVALAGPAALAALADGSVDAAFLSGPEAANLLAAARLRSVHLVPLAAPQELAQAFAPAMLTAASFPTLLKKSETVESVSSALIVAVFEWPKGSPQSETTRKFAGALFQALGANGGAGINLAASVPGWTRARVADELLAHPASIQPVNAEN